MRRFIYTISASLFALAFASCIKGETTSNLEAMVTAQTNQGIQYVGYAQQAEKDGFLGIGSMFRAAAEAQVISASKLNDVLLEMGVKDFEPIIQSPTVGTTAENIKSAIDGVNYEAVTLLPQYAEMARIENHVKAEAALSHAKVMEQRLGEILSLTALALKGGDTIQMFYLCPTCGVIFSPTAPDVCDICDTPSVQFKPFGAK